MAADVVVTDVGGFDVGHGELSEARVKSNQGKKECKREFANFL